MNRNNVDAKVNWNRKDHHQLWFKYSVMNALVHGEPGLGKAGGPPLILGGGLVIGLSFVNKPDQDGVDEMSTAGTLANILFSPTEVFRNLRRHPRFLAALIITTLLGTIYGNLFLSRLGPERVANYAIDKALGRLAHSLHRGLPNGAFATTVGKELAAAINDAMILLSAAEPPSSQPPRTASSMLSETS